MFLCKEKTKEKVQQSAAKCSKKWKKSIVNILILCVCSIIIIMAGDDEREKGKLKNLAVLEHAVAARNKVLINFNYYLMLVDVVVVVVDDDLYF